MGWCVNLLWSAGEPAGQHVQKESTCTGDGLLNFTELFQWTLPCSRLFSYKQMSTSQWLSFR